MSADFPSLRSPALGLSSADRYMEFHYSTQRALEDLNTRLVNETEEIPAKSENAAASERLLSSSPPRPQQPSDGGDPKLAAAVFFLLFSLSIVLLGGSFLLFSSVLSLPSRSSIVGEYNAAVRAWAARGSSEQQAGVFRGEFGAASFTLSGDWNDFQPLVVETSLDALNDEGLDIEASQPLKYSLRQAKIPRPAYGVKGSESYEEIAPMRILSSHDGEFANFLNFSLVLIRQDSSPHIGRHSCELTYFGSYSFITGACLHYSQLEEVCLRVAFNETSREWNFAAPVDGGGWHFTTKFQADNGDRPFGCLYDDETDSWTETRYRPIPNPFKENTQEQIQLGDQNTARRRILQNEGENTGTAGAQFDSSSTGISDSSASSTGGAVDFFSSSAPVVAPRPRLEFRLTVRHFSDPFLTAQALTRNSLWFGLNQYSLFLLSFLLFILGIMAFIPPCIFQCCENRRSQGCGLGALGKFREKLNKIKRKANAAWESDEEAEAGESSDFHSRTPLKEKRSRAATIELNNLPTGNIYLNVLSESGRYKQIEEKLEEKQEIHNQMEIPPVLIEETEGPQTAEGAEAPRFLQFEPSRESGRLAQQLLE